MDDVRGQVWSDTRVRTYRGEPLAGRVRLPQLDGVEPKQDPALDTAIRVVADQPLLVGSAGAAGLLFGVASRSGVLGRTVGGMVGAGLGLAAGMAVSAIAQRVSGRSSSTTDAYVRDVPGATDQPRTGRSGEHLRIMDWNIRELTGPSSAVGFSDEAADAVVATVRREHPDLLVMQEVAIDAVESGRTDQLDMLARRTGASEAVFIPNGRRPDGGLKGNAVLAFGDTTLQDARGLHMPDPEGAGVLRRLHNLAGMVEHLGIHVPDSWKVGYFPRTAGDLVVTTPGGTDVRLVDVHLSGMGAGSGGGPDSQERQLVPIAGTLGAWQGATILAGDFNVNGGSDAHAFERGVLGAGGLHDSFDDVGIEPGDPSVRSFSSSSPKRNIDRVYLSDHVRAAGARVLDDDTAARGSDHLPVVADVVVG
ncbi:MAG: hypothetical protein KDC46_07700 [Thermoleophilia bacterium]|nr:hypothetical protein [Thermoleophilia bacterium]